MTGPMSTFLSAPLWLITTLHIITLTLHFIAMNFVFGGVVTLLFAKLQNKWDDPVVRRLLRIFPAALAATVTFGVAPLLFVQLTYYAEVYSAAIVSGWFWLGIVAAVIAVYYLLYAATFSEKGPSRAPVLLGLSVVGFVYVSFIYSSVFALAENPAAIEAAYAAGQSGWTINPHVGSYIFRWLHMVLGAMTVGGFCVGIVAHDSEALFKMSKQMFLWGAVGATVVGLGYLFSMVDIMTAYMRSMGVWMILITLVLTAGALHFFFQKRFVPAGIMLFVSMLAMVYNRHVVRVLELQGLSDPSSLPVRPQWSIFFVFLICFVIALATVAYMLKLFFGKQEATA